MTASWCRGRVPLRGAVAALVAVSVVALLVGLSVAPQLQPSDTFQVKPRAVGEQGLAAHLDAPSDGSVTWTGGPYAIAPAVAPARPVEPGLGVRPDAAPAPVTASTPSHACRGPPRMDAPVIAR